ncbi:uncharacterized protein METZ01_LOCUS344852 [marine metagenome]|uniref:Uncharacterized protein n=1 Tax=marine metagenome TaxID=408172 RepID=A0A382R4M1_9ZZZZ
MKFSCFFQRINVDLMENLCVKRLNDITETGVF